MKNKKINEWKLNLMLIEKIKGSKITDEINKLITISIKREDLHEGIIFGCVSLLNLEYRTCR